MHMALSPSPGLSARFAVFTGHRNPRGSETIFNEVLLHFIHPLTHSNRLA